MEHLALFKTDSGNIYLVNIKEAESHGCGADSCPVGQTSILEKINSGACEFWSDLFSITFET